jgi:hypothetical protein
MLSTRCKKLGCSILLSPVFFFFLTPGFFTLHFLGLPLCAQLTYVLLKSAAADRDLYEAL